MEKRWSARKELNVDVDVYQHGVLLGSCLSANIGLGGTFLFLDKMLTIQKDQDIDLVFRLLLQGLGTRHNVHARVTRVTDGGVGLKFRDFDTSVFRSLQEIMSHSRESASNQN